MRFGTILSDRFGNGRLLAALGLSAALAAIGAMAASMIGERRRPGRESELAMPARPGVAAVILRG